MVIILKKVKRDSLVIIDEGDVYMVCIGNTIISNYNKYIFIDRDGCININDKVDSTRGPFVLSPEEFIFCPGALEALKLLNDKGYTCFIVTMQNCVTQGLISESELSKIHSYMNRIIECNGGHISDIEVAYTDNDSDDNVYGKSISKYNSIRNLMRKYNIDTTDEIWSVGDGKGEILAGNILGHRTIQVIVKNYQGDCGADYKVGSLLDAAKLITSADNTSRYTLENTSDGSPILTNIRNNILSPLLDVECKLKNIFNTLDNMKDAIPRNELEVSHYNSCIYSIRVYISMIEKQCSIK